MQDILGFREEAAAYSWQDPTRIIDISRINFSDKQIVIDKKDGLAYISQ